MKFEPTTIELTDTDVKTIDLNTNIEQETEDPQSQDSLDEIDSDDEDNDEVEEEPLEAEEVITLTEDDYKKKKGSRVKENSIGTWTPELSLFKKSSFDRVANEPLGFVIIRVRLNLPELFLNLKDLFLGNFIVNDNLKLLT